MKTIRWGIIGCGDVTEVKSGPGLQKAASSELVAVMRRDGGKAEDYARRHGVAAWYDDGQALIDDPNVDVVYVATPPNSHEEYTLKAAAAGKPVYVEKPMARNHAECLRMVAACEKAGVPLFVAFYRRRLPRFLKVKELVDAGALGDLRFVTIQMHTRPGKAELDPNNLPWRVIPEIAGAGRFLDLASHTLDVLDYILGPIEAARGFAYNRAGLYPAEDTVTGTFRFASGVQGTGTWCFVADHGADRIELVGSKGSVRLSTFGTEPVELTTADGVEKFPEPTPPHVQQPLIESMVAHLNGGEPCPSSGESAARTSWVMDEMLREFRAQKG